VFKSVTGHTSATMSHNKRVDTPNLFRYKMASNSSTWYSVFRGNGELKFYVRIDEQFVVDRCIPTASC